MIAAIRNEIASSVQLGLVVSRARCATSIFMLVNIRLGEAGASRLSRSWRVLRHRSRARPISFAGGVPAGIADRRMRRHRDAAPEIPSRRSPRLTSRWRRRPSLLSGHTIQSLPTQGFPESFHFFPDHCPTERSMTERWTEPAGGPSVVVQAQGFERCCPGAEHPLPLAAGVQQQPLPILPVACRAEQHDVKG